MWLPITPHLLVQIVRFELTRFSARVFEALSSANSDISACLLSTPERRHGTLLPLPYTLEQLLPLLKGVILWRRRKDLNSRSTGCSRLPFLLATASLMEKTRLEPQRELIQRILNSLYLPIPPFFQIEKTVCLATRRNVSPLVTPMPPDFLLL